MKDYIVEFNIPVRVLVSFDTETNPGVTWDTVTDEDAIANAIGSLPYGFVSYLEQEGFDVNPIPLVEAEASLQ